MVPTPSESEKKAWPRAAAPASALSLEKSGLSRYATPLADPGRVREYTIMATMSTNSTGMAMLENFSIPFFTPPSTMPATMAMKAVWERMGCQVEEMNLPK